MPKILLIETATRVCSVGVCDSGGMLSLREEHKPNSHASLVAVFIEEILRELGLKPSDLDAVAVSMGPGSYTGLRIGVSSAKGLCYAIKKPLIAISGPESLALGMRIRKICSDEKALFIPMIDARRMEVYTAVYDAVGKEIKTVDALIITPEIFDELMPAPLVLGGDGAEKTKEVLRYMGELIFSDIEPSASFMYQLAIDAYNRKEFADLAYFEPKYLKDFVAGKPKVKGLS